MLTKINIWDRMDLGGIDMAFDIEEELRKLPAKPGVYLMHDEKDVIIYVGTVFSEQPE